MITTAMKALVDARIIADIAKIKAHYGVELKMPSVSYDLRGRTAGTAHYGTWHIRINAVLLAENFEEMLATTVPHELAHLATDQIYPEAHQTNFRVVGYGRVRRTKRQPHGDHWKEVMCVLGVNPKRCHNFDTSNARVKRNTNWTEYKCTGCDEILKVGPKHHAKLQAGAHIYHKGCKQHRLVLVTAHPTRVEVKIAAQQEAPATSTNKRQTCVEWFRNNRTATKQQIINAFVGLGCTPAGASTYYYSIKNMPS